MYSKQEASLLRQEFWTTFGKYMSPVQSSEGTKVNWVNYKTGVKSIYFKMEANNKSATISIHISPKDHDMRIQYLQLFASRIFKELVGVNIFNKTDWPQLISFFKPRLIGLDKFWSEAKYGFDVF